MPKKKKLKPYPVWICDPCGRKYGKYRGDTEVWCSTIHEDECDFCLNKKVMVTEPRDYGWPSFPGHEK